MSLTRYTMASKLKKPPASHKKRTEEPTEGMDTCVKALKKLKMERDGTCVKVEDRSLDTLKHKSDTSAAAASADPAAASAGQKMEDSDTWSSSLQKFCLCEEAASSQRGRRKWKAMCRYHQLRMRSDHRDRKNSLNLAQAARHYHRPLLKESRLLVSADSKTAAHSSPPVLRLPRFTFEKRKKCGDEKSESVEVKLKASTASSSESCKKTAACDKSNKGSKAPTQTVFARAATESLKDFSSLLASDQAKPAEKDDTPVPCFTDFRDSFAHRIRQANNSKRCQALLIGGRVPQASTRSAAAGITSSSQATGLLLAGATDTEATSSALVGATGGQAMGSAIAGATSSDAASVPSAAVPLRDRLDLGVERSCSQEARLDEVECSVNELAAYFDHYFVIPKDMSLMAKMMYT